MKDRIAQILKTKNITATQFADELNVQRSGISHILSGRNNPSLDFVMKIKETYPEFNLEWLILGKGPATGNINSKENKVEQKTEIKQTEFVPDLFSIGNDLKAEVKTEKPVEIEDIIPELEIRPENQPKSEKKASFVEKEAFKKVSAKRIIRLITLYDDSSFDSYEPNPD
jgi:transcriptional regulator with XRE-family HTH domain